MHNSGRSTAAPCRQQRAHLRLCQKPLQDVQRGAQRSQRGIQRVGRAAAVRSPGLAEPVTPSARCRLLPLARRGLLEHLRQARNPLHLLLILGIRQARQRQQHLPQQLCQQVGRPRALACTRSTPAWEHTDQRGCPLVVLQASSLPGAQGA